MMAQSELSKLGKASEQEEPHGSVPVGRYRERLMSTGRCQNASRSRQNMHGIIGFIQPATRNFVKSRIDALWDSVAIAGVKKSQKCAAPISTSFGHDR